MNSHPQPPLLSVIIPARNTAGSIGGLVVKAKESLAGFPHEIIVIDDGSGDGTAEPDVEPEQGKGAEQGDCRDQGAGQADLGGGVVAGDDYPEDKAEEGAADAGHHDKDGVFVERGPQAGRQFASEISPAGIGWCLSGAEVRQLHNPKAIIYPLT